LFGDLREVIVGMFGALEIVVDPHTKLSENLLRIASFMEVDLGLRHVESFSAMNDAITSQELGGCDCGNSRTRLMWLPTCHRRLRVVAPKLYFHAVRGLFTLLLCLFRSHLVGGYLDFRESLYFFLLSLLL
jgi:hypothetical protein